MIVIYRLMESGGQGGPRNLVWNLLCVQLASYLKRAPVMWMITLYLHFNQKSDYDIDIAFPCILWKTKMKQKTIFDKVCCFPKFYIFSYFGKSLFLYHLWRLTDTYLEIHSLGIMSLCVFSTSSTAPHFWLQIITFEGMHQFHLKFIEE